MNIEIKQLTKTAIIPAYKTEGAAGVDLHANIESEFYMPSDSESVLVPTGIAIQIPEMFVGIIVPRSGLGHKQGLVLGNGTGIIDSDYRGEIFVSLLNRSGYLRYVKPDDRIAQLLFIPVTQMTFIEVNELGDTLRNTGGFGSTGNE